MTGYVRSFDKTDGVDPIRSGDFESEFNVLEGAFDQTSGHKHDGTTSEGPYIAILGDSTAKNKVVIDSTNHEIEFWNNVSGTSVQQVIIKDGVIEPITTNDIDLGSSSKKFKNIYGGTGEWNGGHLILGNYHFWIYDDHLYMKNGVPSSGTDGTLVGDGGGEGGGTWSDTLTDLGSVSGTTNLDLSLGNAFYATVTDTIIFSVTNKPTGSVAAYITLIIDNSGSKTISWDSSWNTLTWDGSTAPGTNTFIIVSMLLVPSKSKTFGSVTFTT